METEANFLGYYSVLVHYYWWVGNVSSVTGGQAVAVSWQDAAPSSDACFACAPALYCSFGYDHPAKAVDFVANVS